MQPRLGTCHHLDPAPRRPWLAAGAAANARADLVSFSYQPPTLSELFRQAVAA